jgi:hypothetical protein
MLQVLGIKKIKRKKNNIMKKQLNKIKEGISEMNEEIKKQSMYLRGFYVLCFLLVAYICFRILIFFILGLIFLALGAKIGYDLWLEMKSLRKKEKYIKRNIVTFLSNGVDK